MKISKIARSALAPATCATLLLTLAACSSSGSTSSTSALPAQKASPSASPSDPDAGLPTGAELKTYLVTTGIPSGYTPDPSGNIDSGSGYQLPSLAPSWSQCSNLGVSGWVAIAGYASVSWTLNAYVDKNASEEFLQEIDAYQGTTAQDVMTALSKIATRCPSFADSHTSSTVKVSVAANSSLGEGTVVITLSDPRWVGDVTLEAVREGHSVVTVWASSADSGSLAQSVASKITNKLAAGTH